MTGWPTCATDVLTIFKSLVSTAAELMQAPAAFTLAAVTEVPDEDTVFEHAVISIAVAKRVIESFMIFIGPPLCDSFSIRP